MRKLRLHPDDLYVETFLPVTRAPSANGTVHGQLFVQPGPVEPIEPDDTVDGTAAVDTCVASCTCGDTCYIARCNTVHTGSQAKCC
jgi:hypothetical protein